MRLIIVAFIIGTLLVTMLTDVILPEKDIPCIEDRLFIWTTGINEYFQTNPYARHVFMIICGLMMDISFVSCLLIFVFKRSSSWRLIVTLIMFYVTRFIIQ